MFGKPQDKRPALFYYFNGEKPVFGDPLTLYRRLLARLGSDPNALIEQVNHEAVEVSAPATETFLIAVRAAFDMVPFDAVTGKGSRDEDAFAAFNQFSDFIEKKNLSAATSPTSSPPTTYSRSVPLPKSNTSVSPSTLKESVSNELANMPLVPGRSCLR